MNIVTDGGTCFDLDYDGSGTNGCALQSNTFFNIFFDAGDASEATAIGCRIGAGTYMGSENLFLNCFWIRCKYGINTLNFNALQNSVIGGNMQGCQWGIYAGSGSVTLIDSVGFQLSSQYDIEASASAFDTMVINACRTESPNFVKPGSQGAIITGCTQSTPSTAGYFLYSPGSGNVKLIGCQATGPSDLGGKVYMLSGGTIESCYWTNPDSDILDRIGNPRLIMIEDLRLASGRTAKGWMVGKYVHNTDIPAGTVKWNYSDRETNAQIYGDDLCVMRAAGTGDSCVRANTSKSSGKWYWEVYIHFLSTSGEGPGVANATFTLTDDLGGDTNGISYQSTVLRYNNTTVASVASYTTGDTLSFAMDKDNNKLWVRVNGGNWNNSGSDNPATNTGGTTISVTGALYPTSFIAIEGGSQVGVFQSRRWKYTAPSGFSELT